MSGTRNWEVVQGQTQVCVRLTRREAENKVENDKRLGYHMIAQPMMQGPELRWCEEECEG